MTKVSSRELDAILRSRVSSRYFEIGDRIVAAIPELAGVLEEYVAEWKGMDIEPGPINICDEVLIPFVERCLQDVETSASSLQRAFTFIEELASDDEAEIRDVAQVAVNSLAGNANLDRVAPLIGPRMHEMLRISVSA